MQHTVNIGHQKFHPEFWVLLTTAIFPRRDSHRWLLRRCLTTVAAVLRRQLPPDAGHRRLLQGCLAAVAAVLRRRLPPAKWWESCCEQQNTRRRRLTTVAGLSRRPVEISQKIVKKLSLYFQAWLLARTHPKNENLDDFDTTMSLLQLIQRSHRHLSWWRRDLLPFPNWQASLLSGYNLINLYTTAV